MNLELNDRLVPATAAPNSVPPGNGRTDQVAHEACSDTSDILSVVSSLPFPVAFLGEDMEYRAVSEAFATALGTPRHLLVGTQHLRHCPRFPGNWGEVFRLSGTKASSGPEQDVFLSEGKGRTYFPWTATLWRNSVGVATGVLLSLGDERVGPNEAGPVKSTEQEIMFGRMTRKMAHDFNNILTVVRSGLELALLSDHLQLSAEDMKLFKMLIQNTDHGVTITSKLLAIGRNHSLESTSADMRELLKGMANEFELKAPPGISVSWHDRPGAWRCFIDKQQFKNALKEIIANAVEAMPRGGVLHFHLLSADRSNLCFSVTDTGEGMSPEVLKESTDAFFTTKHGIVHAGLGFTIAEGFFVRSGGSMKVESAPGQGCRVTLTLPFTDFVWQQDAL